MIFKKLKKGAQKTLDFFGLRLVRKLRLVDFCLHEYSSYSEYRTIQIVHNKRKLSKIWADEHTLSRVHSLVKKHAIHREKYFGICHGTRNGFEQSYLNSKDKQFHVIGTEISDTAELFEDTIEWDFHDQNPEWIGRFDFVYSNSLDQSWKPERALRTWLAQLNETGILILEITEGHSPEAANKMDPFGVRPVAFPYVLTMWFGDEISISHSVEKKSNSGLDAWLFVVKRTS